VQTIAACPDNPIEIEARSFGRRSAGQAAARDQKREAIRRPDRDDEPMREIARSYNVSQSTISRLTD
jgi:hypothetical protein